MKPETVGMSSARLARLDEVMKRRYVDSGYLPGMLTYVWRKGQLVHTGMCGADGHRARQADARGRDLPHLLDEQADHRGRADDAGRGGADRPRRRGPQPHSRRGRTSASMPAACRRCWPTRRPAFMTTPAQRPMKVVDLATHTSGLTYGFMMRTAVDAAYRRAKVADRQTAGGLQGMIDQLAQIPLDFSPGTAWNYSVSIDVLGYLVEKLSRHELRRVPAHAPVRAARHERHRVLGAAGQDRALHLLLSARGQRPRAETAGRRPARAPMPSRRGWNRAAAAWSRPRTITCASAA